MKYESTAMVGHSLPVGVLVQHGDELLILPASFLSLLLKSTYSLETTGKGLYVTLYPYSQVWEQSTSDDCVGLKAWA